MRALVLAAVVLAGCGSKTPLSGDDRAGGGPGPRDGVDGGGVVRADASSPDGSERCDGRDEDGDGRVDEGIGDVRCGRGACFRSVPGCVDGRTPACVPGPPGDEVCNEIDDDCDALVDERLPGSRLSEPVIVRDLGEGTSGTCEVCDRAFEPTILPIEDGLLALWQLDFLFADARPNTFVRMLDTTGAPREPPRLMFETNTTFGMRATPIRGGRSLVTYCERFSDGTDHPGSVVVDATGRAQTEPIVYDEENRCTVGVPPVALWLEDHHLIGYSLTDRAGPRPLRTVVTDERGAPTRSIHELDVSRDLVPRPPIDLVRRPEGVLFVSTRVFGFLTDDGELTDPPRSFPLSDRTSATALVPASFGYRVFATEEREIAADPIDIVEYTLAELQVDPRGEPLGAVREVEGEGEVIAAGPTGGDGALLILRSRGENPFSTLDDATILLELDPDGSTRSRRTIPIDEEGNWMDVRFVDNGGQKVVVYVVQADGRNHTQVRLRRFGCEP